jgi:hypothetical protein
MNNIALSSKSYRLIIATPSDWEPLFDGTAPRIWVFIDNGSHLWLTVELMEEV